MYIKTLRSHKIERQIYIYGVYIEVYLWCMVELRNEEGRKKLCVVVLTRIVRLSYHRGTRYCALANWKRWKNAGRYWTWEKWFLNNAMLVVAFRCKKYISSSSCWKNVVHRNILYLLCLCYSKQICICWNKLYKMKVVLNFSFFVGVTFLIGIFMNFLYSEGSGPSVFYISLWPAILYMIIPLSGIYLLFCRNIRGNTRCLLLGPVSYIYL